MLSFVVLVERLIYAIQVTSTIQNVSPVQSYFSSFLLFPFVQQFFTDFNIATFVSQATWLIKIFLWCTICQHNLMILKVSHVLRMSPTSFFLTSLCNSTFLFKCWTSNQGAYSTLLVYKTPLFSYICSMAVFSEFDLNL